MLTISPQYAFAPPDIPPKVGLDMEEYDYLHELGDRIASLSIKQAEELNRYLDAKRFSDEAS
jgi:hypothetical protein